eukprot:2986690-Pleurochrysis_carterae.AAC.2
MVDTFLPNGVPAAVHRTHAPAADDLPILFEKDIAAKSDSPSAPDSLKAYQSLVGALLCCSTQTRPDVAYA